MPRIRRAASCRRSARCTICAFRESRRGSALRVETGVRAGDAISPYYDPMIAKLVVHGPDRAAALAGLADALEATEIAGSITNTAFLRGAFARRGRSAPATSIPG